MSATVWSHVGGRGPGAPSTWARKASSTGRHAVRSASVAAAFCSRRPSISALHDIRDDASGQQRRHVHRRRRAILPQPEQRKRRRQGVEVGLEPDRRTCFVRPSPAGEPVVMVFQGRQVGGRPAQRRQLLHRGAVASVNDRRGQPFEHNGVGANHEAERLADVPAPEIQRALDRLLDDVARRQDGQVIGCRPQVDKAQVVVAVPEREAPRPAAGLDPEQHAHALSALHVGQRGFGADAHRRVDHVGSSTTCCR